MNNKGQSLVIFILFLPIIFLILAIVYDLGSLEITKQKNKSEIKSIISYAVNNSNDKNLENKINTLLDKNINGTKTINITNDEIIINVKYTKESIFPNIIKKNYKIDETYKGNITNKKITKE